MTGSLPQAIGSLKKLSTLWYTTFNWPHAQTPFRFGLGFLSNTLRVIGWPLFTCGTQHLIVRTKKTVNRGIES
jgi:hypothetical protein